MNSIHKLIRDLQQFKPFLRRLTQGLLVCVVALLCISCANRVSTAGLENNPWQVVNLPTEATVLDLAFTDDPNHGWVVGLNDTLLETTDGGETWVEQDLDLDDDRYRLSSVSFQGNEGWIVGQPSILLHTLDGGAHWSRIYLSEQLPGSPSLISALGPNSAELVTDLAAIYRTEDGGKNWKGLVRYGSDTVLNISRSQTGGYVAVSERGTFFSTFEPGQDIWTLHNRTSSRRIQNMGFGLDDRLWLLVRGGEIQFSAAHDFDSWDKPQKPEQRNRWGLLDMAYRTPSEIWAAGGSAALFVSTDGGETWLKNQAVEKIPSNFYRVIFLSPDQGFILGQRGVLLKYTAPAPGVA
jgi:photosystem II stability/assembly factor-like uncharacterized protein